MKILAMNLWNGFHRVYDSIEEAYKNTRVSPKRIQYLIKSGYKYKGWLFDELGE